jgi:3-isopropylmalate dehydratase small subunit
VEIGDTSSIEEGDEIEINLLEGKVLHIKSGVEFQATKLPEMLIEMLGIGGLEPYLAKKMGIETARDIN